MMGKHHSSSEYMWYDAVYWRKI